MLCGRPDDEVDAIVERLVACHDAGTPWSEMAILFGSSRPIEEKLSFACEDRGIPYFCVSSDSGTKRQVARCGDVVRASNVQSVKGLEFSRVFLCAVNNFYTGADGDEASLRQLAYVGMTRAMDELVVTVSGTGPVGRAILAAQ